MSEFDHIDGGALRFERAKLGNTGGGIRTREPVAIEPHGRDAGRTSAFDVSGPGVSDHDGILRAHLETGERQRR